MIEPAQHRDRRRTNRSSARRGGANPRSDLVPTSRIDRLTVTVILAIVLGVTVAWMSFLLRSAFDDLDRAREELGITESARRRSEAMRLILLSTQELERNPTTSLLLALESIRLDHEAAAAGDLALLRAYAACRERKTLIGHSGEIYSASYSPDGQEIVTASADQTARVWDLRTGRVIRVLTGHDNAVLGAQYSPSGDTILTHSLDGTARLWDSQSGSTLRKLAHEGPVLAAAFNRRGDRIATASADGKARLWDATKAGDPVVLLDSGHPLLNVAIGPTSTQIAVLSQEPALSLFDLSLGLKPTQTLPLDLRPPGLGRRLAFSRDGQFVATSTGIVDFARQVFLELDDEPFLFGAFSPSGDRIVLSQGGLVLDPERGYRPRPIFLEKPARLIDGSMQTIRSLGRAKAGAIDVKFAGDGSRFITTYADGTSRLWNPKDGSLIAVLRGHEGAVLSAQFSPDGQSIVTASSDLTARVWSVARQTLSPALDQLPEDTTTLRFSPNGRFFAAATRTSEGSIVLYEMKSPRPFQTWNRTTGISPSLLEFSPDSSRLATVLGDRRTIELLTIDAPVKSPTETGGSDPPERSGLALAPADVQCLAFSPDSSRLAAGCADGRVIVINVPEGQEIAVLCSPATGEDLEQGCLGVAFDPSGNNIVCSSEAGSTLIEIATGSKKVDYIELGSLSAEFTSSGEQIVLTGEGWLAVVDAADGKLLAETSGSFDRSILSPDGTKILTVTTRSDEERGLLVQRDLPTLYDTKTAERRLRFPIPPNHHIRQGLFSPDGGSIVLYSQSNHNDRATEIRVWPVNLHENVEQFKSRDLLPREMDAFQIGTEEERSTYRQQWRESVR